MTRSAIALIVLAVLGAPHAAAAQRRQRDLITRQEILKGSQADQDLFAAITALRPHFLAPPRARRPAGFAPRSALAIYIDGVRQPSVDALHQMMANVVQEARYLDPVKSETEYGFTVNGGAIVIKRLPQRADSVTNKRPR